MKHRVLFLPAAGRSAWPGSRRLRAGRAPCRHTVGQIEKYISFEEAVS